MNDRKVLVQKLGNEYFFHYSEDGITYIDCFLTPQLKRQIQLAFDAADRDEASVSAIELQAVL